MCDHQMTHPHFQQYTHNRTEKCSIFLVCSCYNNGLPFANLLLKLLYWIRCRNAVHLRCYSVHKWEQTFGHSSRQMNPFQKFIESRSVQCVIVFCIALYEMRHETRQLEWIHIFIVKHLRSKILHYTHNTSSVISLNLQIKIPTEPNEKKNVHEVKSSMMNVCPTGEFKCLNFISFAVKSFCDSINVVVRSEQS